MRKSNLILSGIFVVFPFYVFIIFNTTLAQNIYNKELLKPAIQSAVQYFDLSQIHLLDGPFKEALELNHKYLLDLEVSRLLHNYRINSGLLSKAKPLGGWEAPDVELRGHFTGHYLSACALMYLSTGDNKLILKIDSIVDGLQECQISIGKSGYLSAFPESFFDRVESGKRVWAPYYTLHKLFAGLIDVYVHCGNRKALNIAEEMAEWVKIRTDKLSEEQIQKMLKVEFGGMNDMFYSLYLITANSVYLELGRRFEHKFIFDPLSEFQDKLKGLHVNTQIPKIIGAVKAYQVTGKDYYKNIIDFFWKQVVYARSYSTGGTSNFEYWRSEPYHLSDQLSSNDHENCCTHNMLKLTSILFKLEPNAEYADYYERALFNGILGSQHPKEGGAFMYYIPMRGGLFRYFCEPETSFVCCSGTGIESFAKFGDNIYFHSPNDLYVNQYIASELNWPEKKITLVQKTGFPEEQGTTLILRMKNPTNFNLKLRIPYWACNGYKVKINGNLLDIESSPGSYLIIIRKWKDNDKIEIAFPFSFHLQKMPDNPKRASIMYGPLVMAGAMGQKGMSASMMYGMRGDAYIMNSEGAAMTTPKLAVGNKNLNEWFKPVEGKILSFKTNNIGEPDDFILVPFYRLFGERYTIYFDIVSPDEYSEIIKKRTFPDGTVDKFKIGDKSDEDEHDFQAWQIERGDSNGIEWVKSKSWFRFDVSISPAKQNILKTKYFSNDSNSVFNLFIDGVEIRPAINKEKANDFVIIEYSIPIEFTKGKDRIAISYKVPDKNKEVNIGETTIRKELLRYETPKFFECEIITRQ